MFFWRSGALPHPHYPFESQRRVFSTFDQNFDFKIRRDHQKNFLWAPRLWVGRRYRSLLWVISHRSTESSTPGLKGLYSNGPCYTCRRAVGDAKAIAVLWSPWNSPDTPENVARFHGEWNETNSSQGWQGALFPEGTGEWEENY